MSTIHIEAAADTNIGYRRKANQDSFLCEPGTYLVCDGMGGGVGGQRASGATVERFQALAGQQARTRAMIERTLDCAQDDVTDIGQELGGLSGTTVTGLIAPRREDCDDADDWYVINIGDSRTYHLDRGTDGRWAPGTATRITRDHSQRQEAIDSGDLLPDEADAIPRNIITQCVGDPDGIRPDFYAVEPRGRFIICSDGLHGEVDDVTLARTAAGADDPHEAVERLVQLALRYGGSDNITVIVVDMDTDATWRGPWHCSKLAAQEDLDSLGDETLEALRVQPAAPVPL